MNPTEKKRTSQQHRRGILAIRKVGELVDLRPDGSERPWREKKMKNVELALSYDRLGKNSRADRVCVCGNRLGFQENPETNERKLSKANFCYDRLCPMCAWRRSLRNAYVLSTIMEHVKSKHPRLIPLFLTLTVRNCPATAADLIQTFNTMYDGWNRFLQVKRVKTAVKGWFRSLEVTYNQEANTFHPHMHAIFYVDKSYFHAGDRGSYIKTADWVKLWGNACRLDYDPVCHIERAKKGANELSKYVLKDEDYIRSDFNIMDEFVSMFTRALHRRRLHAYGGLLKEIARELKILDKEGKEDLINTGDTIKEDIEAKLVWYFYHFGFKRYLREK